MNVIFNEKLFLFNNITIIIFIVIITILLILSYILLVFLNRNKYFNFVFRF